MDIFKSPAKIQIHGNKNKYNQEKYEWTPRVLSNKYNQRFQTTADLRAREKSNGFLYGK